jgi:transcription initiation factor TFIID subunit 5
MSTATPPASSQSPAATTPANVSQESTNAVNIADRIVLEYLRSRGHASAEKAFKEEMEASSPSDKGKQPEIIPPEELIKSLAIFAQSKSTRLADNALKDSSSVLQALSSRGNSPNIQSLLASIGSVGAEEILSLDPTDKQEGFRELEAWVDGSLDMYRVRGFSTSCIVLYQLMSSRSLSFDQYYSQFSATSTWT